MRPLERVLKAGSSLRSAARVALFAVPALGVAMTASAQAPAPVPIEGTMALEGTVKEVDRAANEIVVTTIDGVEHVYHFTKGLVVHGDKQGGADQLEQLRPGRTVVVHYRVNGAEASADEIDYVGGEGLKTTEGVVTRIDRKRQQITIRFNDGKTETFRLTDRAAVDAGMNVPEGGTDATTVVIYYSDETGQKVAHFFRETSKQRVKQ